MEIIPFPGKIFIKPDKTDLGDFEQVDSRVSESGTVVYLSPSFPSDTLLGLSIGDRIYFKAWGMDSAEIEGVKYFVADTDRHNLLCKILSNK